MKLRLLAAVVFMFAATGCTTSGRSGTAPNAGNAPAAAPAPALPPPVLPTEVPAAKRHGMLTALGDTITSGIASSSPAHAFPALAADLLATNVTNLGRPLATTAGVLALEVPHVPPHTTLVVLDVGTIDASDAATNVTPTVAVSNARRLEIGFDRLVKAVHQRAPRAKIAVVTVRDLGRAGLNEPDHSGAALTAAIHEWNAHEKRIAARNRIAVVDTEASPSWYVASDYDAGRIHPDDAGALRLAKAVAVALRVRHVAAPASSAAAAAKAATTTTGASPAASRPTR